MGIGESSHGIIINQNASILKSIVTYLFNSCKWHLLVKYCVRGWVLLRHCSAEFMKHVLPRLLRPVAPFSVGSTMRNDSEQTVSVKLTDGLHQLIQPSPPILWNTTAIGSTQNFSFAYVLG